MNTVQTAITAIRGMNSDELNQVAKQSNFSAPSTHEQQHVHSL